MRTSSNRLKPVFLLADSQMLFWNDRGQHFLARVGQALDVAPQRAKAAYLGASNGDLPEFFDLFRAAFASLGVSNCMHVHAEASPEELAFLDDSNLILLAGGDVDRGFRALKRAGLVDRLRRYWSDGAILIGVSAGAVQVGIHTDSKARVSPYSLSLVPYVVAAHEGPEWESLGATIGRTGGALVGIGIPAGGAAIVYPDRGVEPIRKPITEVTFQGGAVWMRDLISEVPHDALQISQLRNLNLN